MLIDKAYREIESLKEAESTLDATLALYCALNGALTVYALLDWRPRNEWEAKYGADWKGAHGLCMKIGTDEFAVLHGIVTHTKHAKVSSPLPTKENPCDHRPSYEENIINIIAQNGDRIIAQSGEPLITEDSRITVYFGDSIASTILKLAMKEFVSDAST